MEASARSGRAADFDPGTALVFMLMLPPYCVGVAPSEPNATWATKGFRELCLSVFFHWMAAHLIGMPPAIVARGGPKNQ
jgi:hypothetical protein